MSVSVLAERSCTGVGEGPHWDEATSTLLYVDIKAKEIHRYNTTTATNEKVSVPEDIGFVIPRAQGGYVIGQDRKLSFFDWESKSVQKHVAEVEHGCTSRFNDAKCDPSGRLWAGTMGAEPVPAKPELGKGALYSLDKDDLSIKQHLSKIDISNGLAWSHDNSIMYYIDSVPRKVYVFDFDMQQGTIANQRVAVDFGSEETVDRLGYPDGMCMDQDGKLWVACYAAAKIVRFDPETGKQLQSVDIPALRTTSCCFGGPDYSELFVTCGVVGSNEAEFKKYPLTGSVFKVTGLGVKGMPAHTFAG